MDLYPSDSVFAHDHKSRQSDGKESHVDTSFIYDGKIRGEFSKFKTLFITNKHILMSNLSFTPTVIEKNNNLNKMHLKSGDKKGL